MVSVWLAVFTFGLLGAVVNSNRVFFEDYTIKRDWETKGDGTRLSWEFTTPGFGTCDGLASKYLQTHLFDISPAKWIYVDMFIQMKDCFKFPVSICALNFKMFYYLTSLSVLPHTVKFENFTYLQDIGNTSVLPGLGVFETYNYPDIQLDMRGNKKLFVAFLDNGFCGSIHNFTISYLECPIQSPGMMQFPNTPTPSPSEGITVIGGSCVSGASQVSQSALSMTCSSDGSATFTGECECWSQYENVSFTCQVCRDNFFKIANGNFPCSPCGLNSSNAGGDKDKCTCSAGFYLPKDAVMGYGSNCEQPPGAPANANYSNVTSTSSFIFWDPPANLGTGDDVRYTISCVECGTPFAVDYMYTNITVNLGSFTVYNISITSVNNVTKAIGFANKAYVIFKTQEGVPGVVRDLKVVLSHDGLGVIAWTKPVNEGGRSLRYRVEYNAESLETKETTASIKRPSKTTTYTIRVYAVTDFGQGPPSAAEQLKVFGETGVSAEVTVGIAVALTVLLVIVIIIAVIFYRRRHPKHLQSIRYENGEVKLPNRSSGAKVYIDPTTYQDLTEAVTELAKELEAPWIVLEKIIGGGEFGDVYKGTLERPGQEVYLIAVKTLKHGAARQARDDFLGEAAIMGQFDDPNVIFLEGVVLKEKPIMIVTEYMSNGSLDTFLKKNDNKFASLQLLGMARGVTSGMMYLAELSFIHRDLAARNILVDANLVCKVADFGMSRELKMEDDTYDTKGGKIPVRWTAPEAIQFKKFTTASDVWSFGILLWEIMSYGEKPYWDWGNYEVLERVSTGYRLPPPMGCPKMVHDLMLSSWNKDRVKRPRFRDIREKIDKWIRSPELLQEEASVITRRDDNLDYASMKTINEWLGAFKMSQYTTCFTSHGYSTPRQIFSLTDEDLKMIGIQALGHRNKIMNKINTTKGQLSNDGPNRGKSIRI